MNLSRPNRVSYKLWSGLIVLLLALQFVLSACGNEDAPATTGPNSTTSAPATKNTTATSPTTGGSPAGVPNTPTTGGSTTTTGSTTAVSNPTGAVPTALATATPISGLKGSDQTLTITSGEIQTLDPALANDVGTSFVLRQFYSGLLGLNKNLEVVPDLAASMPQVSENGTLYTFRLRQGAKFHSGREITADDVKFSLERAADPALANGAVEGLPASNYLSDIVGIKDRLEGKNQNIAGITVKDKYTLTIKTDAPKPYFLAKMTYNCFFILNKDSVSKGFDAPDGTGPFMVKEYRKKQQLTLVKNPNFYNGVPALTQVNILLGANAANELVLYEQGK